MKYFKTFLLICTTIFAPTSLADIVLLDVIDGDTIKAELTNAPVPLNHISIRIRGIDTPEIRGKCNTEKQKAREAKDFIKEILFDSENIVTLKNLKWDKYGGRVLADVFVNNENILNPLIERGLAVGYYGERKTFNWCAITN